MTDEEKLALEESKRKESEDKKPSDYEIQLRKENEKLRKDLQGKLKAEETEKEKALAEQMQFKELADQRAQKIAELEKNLGETNPYKEKWESYEKTERERLLSKLPEEKRPKFQNADIDLLRETVELVENKKPSVEPNSRANNSDADLNSAPKTMDELIARGTTYMNEFILKYPEQFGKLQKENRSRLKR